MLILRLTTVSQHECGNARRRGIVDPADPALAGPTRASVPDSPSAFRSRYLDLCAYPTVSIAAFPLCERSLVKRVLAWYHSGVNGLIACRRVGRPRSVLQRGSLAVYRAREITAGHTWQ